MKLFPYKQVRPVQDQFMDNVAQALSKKTNLIVHAPTGLGKIVGVMAPALEYALEHDLTILFLTSRHTQHHLGIETLKDIKKAHDVKFTATDIIGKKWMCNQPGTATLYSGEFAEFCRKHIKDKTCDFYVRTRENVKLTVRAKNQLKEMSAKIWHTEEMIEECKELCPYEMSLAMAEHSNVIVADYYYVFHPNVSEMFFKRINKTLDKCIIVVDEAHNLPIRIRDLASAKLTGNILKLAIREAKKSGYDETVGNLVMVQDIMNDLGKDLQMHAESGIVRDAFMKPITANVKYDQLIADLEFIADEIRMKQRQSFVGSVAAFLEHWQGPDKGYCRILKLQDVRGKPNLVLSNNCLDPAVVSEPVITAAYSTIMMSGTLTPTTMYKDLIGFEEADEATYESPFPFKNRLNLVVPRTTTKFTARSDEQFKRIAQACAMITDEVPGNSILFFPSYFIRDVVYKSFASMGEKTCFLEKPEMGKEDRQALLDKFKEYKEPGAVLLAVASGSFSEGIDLPGDLLKCVVVIGLPSNQPDLETKELINYYDNKFGKGWDYGYIFPAFNKALQSAGRCIRSETDRGVTVFLDERYLWPRYKRLFPDDMEIDVSTDFVTDIAEFYSK